MKREELLRSLPAKEHYQFEDLSNITALLRGEGGCPWDREQTHESVRRCMIEEAYEVAEAIDKKDSGLLCEELGDVLFQVLFHSQIEREAGRFSINDVIDGICKKMIHRHPHVFGTAKAESGEAALAQWEAMKSQEKQRTTTYDRLASIPAILPALLRAQKVHEKIGEESVKTADKPLDQLLSQYVEKPDEETLGRLLFTLTKSAVENGLNAEYALSRATDAVILSTK